MYGVIYLIKDKTNDKIYVGQTTRSVEERFLEHSKADSYLGRAIRKHGKENFSIEILVECQTQKELDEQERIFIEKFNCKHPNGYNFTEGGRRSQNGKNNAEKQLDPRKEFLFKLIGAKIAYYRTLRDMSQKELAKRANLSVSALSKIERGRYNDNVSVSLLFDIADGLQIDITMLVTFSDLEKTCGGNPSIKNKNFLSDKYFLVAYQATVYQSHRL